MVMRNHGCTLKSKGGAMSDPDVLRDQEISDFVSENLPIQSVKNFSKTG